MNYGSEIELFINVVQDSRQQRSQKLCHTVGLVSLDVSNIKLGTLGLASLSEFDLLILVF